MNVAVIGCGSEIAQNLAKRLSADGWGFAWPWDLAIFARGTMEPIGKFFDTNASEWEKSIRGNGLNVLTTLRVLWPERAPKAQVVFLGGPNMAKPNETYSAYRCGKAVLEAIVPTLNAEYPEHRFHILHPGVVNTKFHRQTLSAGERAANLDRVQKIVSGEEPTVTHDEVYAKLRGLIA